MGGTLVVVPCGQGKIWDKDPGRGPTPAREAYTGAPFKVNRAYAERFGDRWIILSAKYGFIAPDFLISGPYDVSFNRRATNPIDIATLSEQVREQRLSEFDRVIGLGGKDYRSMVEQAVGPLAEIVAFPFAGLPIGRMMQCVKRAVETGESMGATP